MLPVVLVTDVFNVRSEPDRSPPIASHGLGENGELDECGGVLGRLDRPGQSGSDPVFLSSSHSFTTFQIQGQGRGRGRGGAEVIQPTSNLNCMRYIKLHSIRW